MQLSVIILNYNVSHFLQTCIKSVQRAISAIEAEIIVVDNASSDDSVEMMHAVFPEITFIANKENAGFPKGNNMGVDLARGKYICILNPDTIVGEHTFTHMIAFADSKKQAGIIGCKMIDGSGHFLPESKRSVPTPWVAFTKVTGLYKIFPHSGAFNRYYAQHLKENESGKVDILAGAFMFMERELYIKVGGFDEQCFMYSDDIDLSYTVLKQQKENFYFSDVSIIHFKGESTLKDNTYMRRFKDAMHFFYSKHFSASFLFNMMMEAGILLFAFKKKTEKGIKKKKPQHYVLVSQNKELVTILEKKLLKKPERINFVKEVPQILEKYQNQSVEILYDADHNSYEEYINLLETYQNTGISFKIKPHYASFFIGSDDKNGRGEVIKFSALS
ncbi:glycosyltransferase [Paenimyroides ceti]